VRFVRRLIGARRIVYIRVGRHVRIAEADLAGFVAAGRQGRRRFGAIRRLPSGRYQVRYRTTHGRHDCPAQQVHSPRGHRGRVVRDVGTCHPNSSGMVAVCSAALWPS
jgi:excisionase family DNA binding protein